MYIQDVTDQSFSAVMESLKEVSNEYATHMKVAKDVNYVLEHIDDENMSQYQREKLHTKMKEHGLSNEPVQEGVIGSVFGFIWKIIKGLVKAVLYPFKLIYRALKAVFNWFFGNAEQIEKRAENVDKAYKMSANDVANLSNAIKEETEKEQQKSQDNSEEQSEPFEPDVIDVAYEEMMSKRKEQTKEEPAEEKPSKVDAAIDRVSNENNGVDKVTSALSNIISSVKQNVERKTNKPADKKEAGKERDLVSKNKNLANDPEFIKFTESKRCPFENSDKPLSEQDIKRLEEAPINLSSGNITAGQALWIDRRLPDLGMSNPMTQVFALKAGATKNSIIEQSVKVANMNLSRIEKAFAYIKNSAKSEETIAKLDTFELVSELLTFISPSKPSELGLSLNSLVTDTFNEGGVMFSKKFIDEKYRKREMFGITPTGYAGKQIQEEYEQGLSFPHVYYYHFPEIDELKGDPSKIEKAMAAHAEVFMKQKETKSEGNGKYLAYRAFVMGLINICSPHFTCDMGGYGKEKVYDKEFLLPVDKIKLLNEDGKGANDKRSLRRVVDLIVNSENSGFKKERLHKLQDETTSVSDMLKKTCDNIEERSLDNGNLGINTVILMLFASEVRDLVIITIQHMTYLLGEADRCNRFLELAILKQKAYLEKAAKVKNHKEAAILWYKFIQ